MVTWRFGVKGNTHMDTGWYNSSALMGLLGVFLGAILSFLGTMYSEYAKLKTLKTEQEFKEREKQKKSENWPTSIF